MARLLHAALAALAAAAACAVSASALSLPATFGSHMVLQHGAAVPIWGLDTAGSTVTVVYGKQKLTTTTPPSTVWQVMLPAAPASMAPTTISITSSAGGSVTWSDVVVGDVLFCSGQSNMELPVSASLNYTDYVATAPKYAKALRGVYVALTTAPVPNATVTVSQPWEQVAVGNMASWSAACTYTAMQLVDHDPSMPIGIIMSSWGGTAINVWMSPKALQACASPSAASASAPAAASAVQVSARSASASLAAGPDPGLGYMRNEGLGGGVPTNNSVLWNAMVSPWLDYPVKAFVWYQGESNAGAPNQYACLFPAMIRDWRANWQSHNAPGAMPPAPAFVFVQVSAWPSNDNGMIPTIRYAQMAALAEPRVGVVVAADIGDPASAAHPIHPPYKQEVGRRAALALRAVAYNDTSVPRREPLLVSIDKDDWNAGWGDYHHGYGRITNVCNTGIFQCFGLRLKFDQPLELHGSYELINGAANAFRLYDATGSNWQDLAMTGLDPSDSSVVQLNVTWTHGNSLGSLQYGWHDYPNLPLTSAAPLLLPVSPFNSTLPNATAADA